MDTIIQTNGLTKYYNHVRGIEDLTLEVKEGEIFGFLGPNGAGKTTTIRLLLDFIRPTRGQAKIFGLDSRKQSTEIKRRVGNLPGELNLYQNLTGEQLLEFLGSLRGTRDQSYRQQLAQRLDVDLSRPIKHYSHGTKQKVGLIQALMHRPPLLILDEPTLGLDPLVQQEFYNLLEETRAEGRTVFFSSHILPEVERICDRVAVIREGRLVVMGSVAELKRKAPRRMELVFAHPVPPQEFALPEVTNVVQEDKHLRFFVHGNIDGVIKAAARFPVVNMYYHEATLEDIFLAYYKEDNEVN
ncbi:MAG: ABC transporter ATP-binding protein [Chloroflexi bacterium]|nr:ABC transporter ATP-binding protein [Chloroflexota bacterium]MCL5075659.1 ABC transporter ATP-binding protein [Chloroflexota bacterium]